MIVTTLTFDMTHYEILSAIKVSVENEISILDLILTDAYFKQLFFKRANIENLSKIKNKLSLESRQELINIYTSLEMYEICEVLKQVK